jgi:hypothetical protein
MTKDLAGPPEAGAALGPTSVAIWVMAVLGLWSVDELLVITAGAATPRAEI